MARMLIVGGSDAGGTGYTGGPDVDAKFICTKRIKVADRHLNMMATDDLSVCPDKTQGECIL